MANHIAEYNGKRVDMGYVPNAKDQFKFACQRVRDNAQSGYVHCPDGSIYAINRSSRMAVRVSGAVGSALRTVSDHQPAGWDRAET